jgi:hypothetical protein
MIRPLQLAGLCVLLTGAASCALTDPDGAGAASGPELIGALKMTALASHARSTGPLVPDRNTLTGAARLRLTVSGRPREDVSYEFAYEQRMLATTGSSGGGGFLLPSDAGPFWRLTDGDWRVFEGSGSFTWRQEIDRALVAFHPDWGEAVIGRQAIGLGRGVVFSAVDMFNPFTPAEIDREWRRGVDAARVEYRLTDTSSAEFIGVFGEDWDNSAAIGRFRGYFGDVDAEVLFGKRAEDLMAGAVVSAIVGQSEVHGEIAVFDTPEDQPDGGLFGNDHLVPKLVLGGSHTFDVGNGLTVVGEYHYSGFGMDDAEDAALRLAFDPVYAERLARGDFQILTRHGLAGQCSYPFSPSVNGALLLLFCPTDGSGLLAPNVRWDLSDNTSMLATTYLPWGEGVSGFRLGSEYGATPYSLFLQLTHYF